MGQKSSPRTDGCQVRDDPVRTVVVADDDDTVVAVQAGLYQSLADRLNVCLEFLVSPGGPLSCHDVPGLDGGDLGVGFGYLEQ